MICAEESGVSTMNGKERWRGVGEVGRCGWSHQELRRQRDRRKKNSNQKADGEARRDERQRATANFFPNTTQMHASAQQPARPVNYSDAEAHVVLISFRLPYLHCITVDTYQRRRAPGPRGQLSRRPP